MPVLINFKICDNAEECYGIEKCPTQALSWDKTKKSVKIDNSKCTSCGICEKSCEVYAIRVAKNEEEYAAIQKEFDDDPRKISDLCIDRFGAQPIFPACMIKEDEFAQHILEAGVPVAVELYKKAGLECMIKSIPIKELLGSRSVKFRKMEVESDKITNEYKVNQLPALLFFDHGKLIGKIEGFFGEDRKPEIKKKIDEILEKSMEAR